MAVGSAVYMNNDKMKRNMTQRYKGDPLARRAKGSGVDWEELERNYRLRGGQPRSNDSNMDDTYYDNVQEHGSHKSRFFGMNRVHPGQSKPDSKGGGGARVVPLTRVEGGAHTEMRMRSGIDTGLDDREEESSSDEEEVSIPVTPPKLCSEVCTNRAHYAAHTRIFVPSRPYPV
jgi:hypothetical protein